MRVNIRIVDMHLRDQRLYEALRQRSVDGRVLICQPHIANEMGCCRRTVQAMLKRLECGGYLKRISRSRNGITYKIVEV